jgi:hypothetical protein
MNMSTAKYVILLSLILNEHLFQQKYSYDGQHDSNRNQITFFFL